MHIPLSAYFSHSWSDADLPANLMLWEQIADKCRLLIDKPEPTFEDTQPYFISRIEALMRRADVFVACIPTLPAEKQKPRIPNAIGDWRHNLCSPYILFELRLAERLDIPRLVLYDRNSEFRPPAYQLPHVLYVGRRFDELGALLAARTPDTVLQEQIKQWLDWISKNVVPRQEVAQPTAAYLLGNDADIAAGNIAEVIEDSGFERPRAITSLFHTDAELYCMLRSIGVLVADVSKPELQPLYLAAHSLMVPVIRLSSQVTQSAADQDLPPLLRGHPAGYQNDIVSFDVAGLFQQRLADRARAITRSAQPVIGREQGNILLYERTYKKDHFVFVSHDEKFEDRSLVNAIVQTCKAKGIKCWEYALENRAGEEWKTKMDAALQKTTHMICLLSPGYEQSPGCAEEWAFALDHKLPILPFLTRGRSRPAVDLRDRKIAHEPLFLFSPEPEESANRIVTLLRSVLLGQK